MIEPGIIHCGDCLELMRGWPDGCIDCCVTSPPYYGLRDYGTDGQLGLEPTMQEYIDKLVAVFREVRRVLKPEGTLWLNIGDSYASTPPGNKTKGVSASSTLHGVNSDKYRDTLSKSVQTKRNTITDGLKPKDLCMIPARVALALQADGWYLRSDIIWAKLNPMPESVTDRPTSAYEHVYLLTASGSTLVWRHRDTRLWAWDRPEPDWRWVHRDTRVEVAIEPPPDWRWRRKASKKIIEIAYEPPDLENWKQINLWRRFDLWSGYDYWYDADAIAEPAGDYSTVKMPDGWDTGAGAHGSFHRNGREKGKGGINAFRGQGSNRDTPNGPANRDGRDMRDVGAGNTRNARNVWSIATKPYSQAHFATFPPELPRRCILAGCPAGGTVLDPFIGSGTVGMVAEQLGRQWIGIELNAEYAEMARKRTAQRGLFVEAGND